MKSTRRNFLKTSGAALASTALFSSIPNNLLASWPSFPRRYRNAQKFADREFIDFVCDEPTLKLIAERILQLTAPGVYPSAR